HSCWTITNLSGVGVDRLRVKTTRAVAPRSAPRTTTSCPSGYYKNSSGHCVHRPSSDPNEVPGGPTAQCRDGSYSYSEHASGTCSHHGGVARWIHHPWTEQVSRVASTDRREAFPKRKREPRS